MPPPPLLPPAPHRELTIADTIRPTLSSPSPQPTAAALSCAPRRPLPSAIGACEGSLACSTCHVVVEDEAYYNKLPEATEDELDMLDLAFGLTDT